LPLVDPALSHRHRFAAIVLRRIRCPRFASDASLS